MLNNSIHDYLTALPSPCQVASNLSCSEEEVEADIRNARRGGKPNPVDPCCTGARRRPVANTTRGTCGGGAGACSICGDQELLSLGSSEAAIPDRFLAAFFRMLRADHSRWHEHTADQGALSLSHANATK